MTAPHLPYRDLSRLADMLFARSGDDDIRLAAELDSVDPDTRRDLLASDLLNAYQVFYYYFREEPEDLERELLMLQPASVLVPGIILREIDYLTMVFRVERDGPVITITGEDEDVLVNYRGKDAYRRGVQFIDENL
ncbi:MAG: hypothetical protein LUQ25_03590 [Methanoregulaceae archaeon]|nr:hypothetical protein [Methanoregulaceae archaeon]